MRWLFYLMDDEWKPDASTVSSWIMTYMGRALPQNNVCVYKDRKDADLNLDKFDVVVFHPLRFYDKRRRDKMFKFWDEVLITGICPVLLSDDLNVLDRHNKIFNNWLGNKTSHRTEHRTQILSWEDRLKRFRGPILHTNFEHLHKFWTARSFEHVFCAQVPVKGIVNTKKEKTVVPKFNLGYVGCWAPRRIKHLRRYRGPLGLVGPGWSKQDEHPFIFDKPTPFRYIMELYQQSRWTLHLQDDWVATSGARVSRIAESLHCGVPVIFDKTQVDALPALPWNSVSPWIASNSAEALNIMKQFLGREEDVVHRQLDSDLFGKFYQMQNTFCAHETLLAVERWYDA
jgi:hypothetical protein